AYKHQSNCNSSARISVTSRSVPLLSFHFLVRNVPSIYTFPPFLRYLLAISAKRLLVVILCHSVASLRSPVVLSFQNSDVATLNVVTLPPLGNCFVSGSRPSTPITVTLFKFGILQFSIYIFPTYRKP